VTTRAPQWVTRSDRALMACSFRAKTEKWEIAYIPDRRAKRLMHRRALGRRSCGEPASWDYPTRAEGIGGGGGRKVGELKPDDRDTNARKRCTGYGETHGRPAATPLPATGKSISSPVVTAKNYERWAGYSTDGRGLKSCGAGADPRARGDST